MVEPVQNCFTFYHPDGISSAHTYPDQHEEPKNNETEKKATSIIAQQDLALSPKRQQNISVKNSHDS